MANLPELNEFTPGVYQIETADPVLGGVDGTTNVPLKALANRTQWLKQQVDSLNTAIASAIGAAYVQEELNKLPHKAPVAAVTTTNIVLSGLQTVDGVALTAGRRVLVAAQTTAAQNGIYLVQAGAWVRAADMDADTEIQAGVQVMVSGGNVFADTIWHLLTDGTITIGTTAQAWKCLTNNTALLGNPTAPTPAQFDNDTSLATTAFVRNELLGLGNAAYDAIFGKSLSASGWQRLPGGLIVQWGSATMPASAIGAFSTTVVSMPIAWPNSLLSAQVTQSSHSNTSGAVSCYAVEGVTTTQFSIVRTIIGSAGTNVQLVRWVAFGF